MIAALDEAWRRAEGAMTSISRNIKKARQHRLVSRLLVLIGRSSLLGMVALDKKPAAVISAAEVTCLAGQPIAEKEGLLNPQSGTTRRRVRNSRRGLQGTCSVERTAVGVKYAATKPQWKVLITQANELCEQLNGWLVQLLKQLPVCLLQSTLRDQMSDQRFVG